jgi:hypothetical protein
MSGLAGQPKSEAMTKRGSGYGARSSQPIRCVKSTRTARACFRTTRQRRWTTSFRSEHGQICDSSGKIFSRHADRAIEQRQLANRAGEPTCVAIRFAGNVHLFRYLVEQRLSLQQPQDERCRALQPSHFWYCRQASYVRSTHQQETGFSTAS